MGGVIFYLNIFGFCEYGNILFYLIKECFVQILLSIIK